MINNKIHDDFFKNAILKGDTSLYDDFSQSVIEKQVGPDVFFEIKKDSDHYRINERITKIVLSQVPINSSACGFVPNKSYYDFLKPHIKGYYFLRLDIKNFFHSIPKKYVEELFKQYFSDKKNEQKYSSLELALMSVLYKTNIFDDEKDKIVLPIGFPSSPVISNILFRKIDILIQKFCEEKNIIYSRYADDMLFSSSKSNYLHSEYFEREISFFLSTLALKLKRRKRKATENTISLNGYVIQNEKPKKRFLFNVYKEERVGTIRLSNKKIKIIKKLSAHLIKGSSPVVIMENLFNLNPYKFKKKYNSNIQFYNKYSRDQLQNKIKGYRSYLVSLIRFNEKHGCIDKKCLETAIKLVSILEDNIT
ncbi:reverse transcriptase [Vibrio parahaemolyticus]|uniref:reverse transcriptase family protein n=1 Tax=Vibrio parahaemolyticus TaxID=670 RepID=UPI00084A7FB3|nr:reverse transcriptase family protein [Vibrio parahaemolyticus]ODZ32867.1 reverse transcriptase [Vibrio parahaemolyticus]